MKNDFINKPKYIVGMARLLLFVAAFTIITILWLPIGCNSDNTLPTPIETSTTYNIEENTEEPTEETTTVVVDETEASLYDIAKEEISRKIAEKDFCEDQLTWYLEYKELRLKYNDYIPYKTIYDEVLESEIYIMQRCVETEVYQKGFIPKCNVVSVILNRAIANHTTAEEVVTKPRQFAYWRTEISETTKLAVEYVYEFGDTTNGAYAFRSDIMPMKWYDWTYQFSDGCHHFYK